MRLDQGRLASRLESVRVEAGDVIQLQAALARGDAHYDITNIELTISLRDGSARVGTWRVTSERISSRATRTPTRSGTARRVAVR